MLSRIFFSLRTLVHVSFIHSESSLLHTFLSNHLSTYLDTWNCLQGERELQAITDSDR